jgi:Coenzyme PQQ synthesis protein D (PqqD)
VLVYDVRTNKAHVLNKLAALVWQCCDGSTPVADVTRRFEAQGTAAGELVAQALRQLEQADLVRDQKGQGVSRREFGRRIGQVGLATSLVPLVTSITAPPAMAACSSICPLYSLYQQFRLSAPRFCSFYGGCGEPVHLS